MSFLDDSVDTLTYVFTTFFFIVSAVLVKQNSNCNIDFWIPPTYSNSMEELIEGYCFDENVYSSPKNMSIGSGSSQEEPSFNYYQWSALYLATAAMVSMLPAFVWKLSQFFTNMPILYFCKTASTIEMQTPKERKDKVKEMAELLKDKLLYSMPKIRSITAFTFVKILYIVISFLQFVMLGLFLRRNEFFWGFKLVKMISGGITQEESELSRREILCEIPTVDEKSGKVHISSIKCLLGYDEFNEMIYLLLWFWLLFTLIVTVVGNISMLMVSHKYGLARSLLYKILNDEPENQIKVFLSDFLTKDGQLVLSYVRTQSHMVAQEMALELFEMYKTRTATRSVSDHLSSVTDADSDSDGHSVSDADSDSNGNSGSDGESGTNTEKDNK